MTVGTRSVLYGAHCWCLHPWFVAWAWWTLYGFPSDPRLWVAFFVHDLGYIGKPNMDGPEGETHPILGATILSWLFDGWWRAGRAGWNVVRWRMVSREPLVGCRGRQLYGWGVFALLHSRYFAKTLGEQPSRLCIADKLAIALTPAWLYLPMVRATGEIAEYMAHAKHRVKGNEALNDDERRRVTSANEREWYAGVQSYCRRWAFEHRDGKADTWTSDARQRAVLNDDGVWQ
jgi:hypothetical protein